MNRFAMTYLTVWNRGNISVLKECTLLHGPCRMLEERMNKESTEIVMDGHVGRMVMAMFKGLVYFNAVKEWRLRQALSKKGKDDSIPTACKKDKHKSD